MNVGFVEIINQNKNDDADGYSEHRHSLLDNQENQREERASSCKDPDDKEDHDDYN